MKFWEHFGSSNNIHKMLRNMIRSNVEFTILRFSYPVMELLAYGFDENLCGKFQSTSDDFSYLKERIDSKFASWDLFDICY